MLRTYRGVSINNLYVKNRDVFYQVYWTHDGIAFYKIDNNILVRITPISIVYARYTGDVYNPPPATALPWKKPPPLERSKLRHEQKLA